MDTDIIALEGGVNLRSLFQNIQLEFHQEERESTKSQVLFVFILTLIFGLTLAVGLGQAQAVPAAGLGPQPEAPLSLDSSVGSKISYQGLLKENGEPVNGSRDMIFRLYSDSACTAKVGSDIANPGVPVNDGLFTVELEVSHSSFDGKPLYLEVEVAGAALGCKEVLPVPYALSVRPGAVISYTHTGPALLPLPFSHTNLSGALNGYANWRLGSSGYDLRTGTRTTIGVYGEAEAEGGYGGYFTSNELGTALYAQGDAAQSRGGSGMVKAAVYAECSNVAHVHSSFNTVGGQITISGTLPGECTLNFGFKIDDRFFSATAVDDSPHGVTCSYGSTTTSLDCFRWNSSGGAASGPIMVVIY